MLRRHVPTLEERRIAENRLLALYGEHRDALLADIQPNPDISQLMLPATLEMRPSWRAYVIMTTLALGISFCLANFLMPVGRTGADVFIGFLIIAIILLVTLSSFNLAAYNSLTVTDVGIERRSFLTRHFLAWSDITLFAIEPTSSSHCYTRANASSSKSSKGVDRREYDQNKNEVVMDPLGTLQDHFAHLEDPRVPRTKLHLLSDILVIALCAVIGGASSWDDIALFGEAKRDWFATFLALPHGIPSHDTFNRVFAALDAAQFEHAFSTWVQNLVGTVAPQVIALDGKTLRGSRDAFHAIPALHLVSAWASTNRVVLAQVAVADKSNEITALPQILAQLDISGCVVTIDAMGCQRAIAQQIVQQGGQYLLAVKDNQPDLAQDVAECFAAAGEVAYDQVQYQHTEQIAKGHGRLETRRHEPTYLTWLQDDHQWPALAAVGRVDSERRFADGHCESATR